MKKILLFLLILLSGVLVGCTDIDPNPEVKTYQVDFVSDNEIVDTITIDEGLAIGAAIELEKEGFEFKGWFFDENFTEEWFIETDLVTGNITLYAKWVESGKVNDTTYQVTLNPSDGQLVGPEEFEILENSLIPTPVITREGYILLGWFTEDNVLWNFESDYVTSNLVLIAKWQPNLPIENYYEVIFELDGGESEELLQLNVLENSKISPPNVQKEGFKLVGWFLPTNVKWNFSNDLVTENITLTARWELLNDNGGEEQIIYEHNFDELGKESTFLTFDSTNNTGTNYGTYTYEGYEYKKGYKIDGKGFINFTTTEDDLVLLIVVGRREEVTTIMSVGNESRTIVNKHEVFEFDLTSAGTYKIAREGGNKEYGIFYLKIYSKESLPTVTFDTNGGNIIQPMRVEKGSLLEMPVDPILPDYDFVGWYIDEDFTTMWDFSADLVYEDITLYAKWDQLATFTVSIDGTVYFVKDGRPINVNPVAITGKVFTGWKNEFDQTYLPTSLVTENLVLSSTYRDAEEYAVTVDLDGGVIVGNEEVILFYENEVVNIPTVTKEGFIFAGFFKDVNFQVPFNDSYLTSDITVYVLWLESGSSPEIEFGAYFEAFWVEWDDVLNTNVDVTYQVQGTATWKTLDKELIRQIDSNTVRADIVGLKAGHYNVLVNKSNNAKLFANGIEVMPHDRSGYAHFNYTEGIGAYNDDGTVKENAVVVYVTDENKDTIVIPGLGHSRPGIGWILNNNQYSSSTSNTQSSVEYANSLAYFDRPLLIRFIGTINVPAGLTIYNSTEQGGSKGDNGGMARMKNANNVTLEGIGEDAVIFGWGVHFMSSLPGRGIGFEIRNLTFDKYPEDAVGLEGVQTGDVLTAPVQRGWIHNSTFLEGYHPNPAESDKKEGDGSLDIKRGEYFTISYNEFINGSKTNLVGASDKNLQFHITYHHNLWRNSRSRIPLTRNANVHMYNNVFETVKEQTLSTDYVQNTRANAYIFSEANFFMGVKSPSLVRSGAIKSYNDVKYSIWENNDAIHVSNRETLVSSGNRFENFDTNPEVFYYDAINKVSDVMRLTDAVTARNEVYRYAGTFHAFDEISNNDLKITDVAPTLIDSSVEMNTSTKIVKGVPLLVFEILTDATFTMVSTDKVPATLVDIYGREMLTGSGMVLLTPGVYSLQSSINYGYSKGQSQAKDSKVDSYKIELDSGAASQARIDNALNAISALPNVEDIEYINSHLDLINNAITAYNHLRGNEIDSFDYSVIQARLDKYILEGKTLIESLINQIGEVTESSLQLIDNARASYNNAIPEVKQSISNLNILVEAESSFEQFRVVALNNLIDILPDVDSLLINDFELVSNTLSDYLLALSLYEGLDEELLGNVVNFAKVLAGINKLEEIITVYELIDYIENLVIAEITLSDGNDILFYVELYDTTASNLKELVDTNTLLKLEEALTKYETLLNETRVYYIYYQSEEFNTLNDSNTYFTGVMGSTKDGNKQGEYKYNGVAYARTIEANSSFELNFTTTAPQAIFKIFFTKGNSINIDGKVYTGNVGEVLEVTLPSGSHTVVRATSGTEFGYIEVVELGG